MANLDELRAQLAEAKKAHQEADRANRKAQDQAWKTLVAEPGNWEWRAWATAREAWPGNSLRVVGANVEKRLRPKILAQWKHNGPGTFAHDFEEEGRWFGMFYFRTDEGILTREGGGYMVLREPKLCSDEEWVDILAGRPAAKFIR